MRSTVEGLFKSAADIHNAPEQEVLLETHESIMSRELRIFVRIARIAGAAGAFSLSACGAPPVPFPDFCEEQNRVIPGEERIFAALKFAAKSNYDRRLPHFTAFRVEMQGRLNGPSDHDIAEAYLEHYPECCEVVQPWVVTDYYEKASWLGEHEGIHSLFETNRDFEWSHDVAIAPTPPLGRGTEPIRIQSSSCGEADHLTGG